MFRPIWESQADPHGPLESCRGILQSEGHALQSEGHAGEAEAPFGREGRRLLLIFLGQPDLVVPGKGIQETEEIASCRGIYNLVDPWKWERILWASAIEICEIHAQPFVLVLLRDGNRIGDPSRMENFSNGPCCLQLVNFIHDEVLAIPRLSSCLLLDGSRIWTDG